MIVIKEKELQEFRPQIRYQDGQDITLQAIQSLLQGEAQQAGIPIAFRLDQVRGGLFGGAEDCLVLYHPEHQKDYFSVAVRIKRQGNYAFVSAESFGTSKLIKAEAVRKQFNAAAKEGIHYRGYNPLENAAAGAAIVGRASQVSGTSSKGKVTRKKWRPNNSGIPSSAICWIPLSHNLVRSYVYPPHHTESWKKEKSAMPSSDYNRYLAAIKVANDSGNKDALRKIRDALLAEYGPLDDDVEYLLRQFRYYV